MSSTIFDHFQGGKAVVKSYRCFPAAIIQAALLTIGSVHAQDTTKDEFVTRKEYDQLKAELLAMKKELDAHKKEKVISPDRENSESHSIADTAPQPQGPERHAVDDTNKEVTSIVARPVAASLDSLLGTTKFLLAGWAEGMFEARNGQVSTFSASFNPIFLWELTPKLLFDSRLEIEPSGGGTNVNLLNAQLS